MRLNPPLLGIDLQEPVDGLGLDARRFGHSFRRAARGRAEQQPHALGRKDLEDRIDDRGLADARAPSDHQRLGGQRLTDRRLLTVGKLQSAALFNPRYGLRFVDPRPGQPAARDADQSIGDRLLRPVEAREEHAGGVVDLVGDHGAVGSFELESRQDQFFRRFEQFFGERNQLIRRQPAMTFVHRLRQRIRYAGAQADHGGLFDAELHRDRIGGLEADPPDVPGEAIGVLGHDLHGVDAVGLEDADGPGGSDPVAMKEDHDLPDDLLLGPGVGDPLGPNHANAGHFAKPIGFGLDDVEDLLAEGLDHFLGVDRPDAPDHAGAEIFLDPFD